MRTLQVVVSLVLSSVLTVCHAKAIKIHGYVTSVASPTRFYIEDFKITRDQTLTPKDGSETGADQGAVYWQRQSPRVWLFVLIFLCFQAANSV